MRPFRLPGIVLVFSLAAGPLAAAQKAAAAPNADTPGYYFLLARHLESAKKVDEAIAALKKAIELSPRSAELRAELAALYARQDRAEEAVQAAEAALEQDPSNHEANKILGSVYAAFSEQRQPLRPGDDPAQYRAKAIAALEKSRREIGVDLNLELMLGRLYLQASDYDKAIVQPAAGRGRPARLPRSGNAVVGGRRKGRGSRTTRFGRWSSRSRKIRSSFAGHVRLAELYERQHRFQQAADAYGQAQAANSRADLGARRAASLINAGKPAEARELLQAAIAHKSAPDAGLLLHAGAVAAAAQGLRRGGGDGAEV